MEIRVLGPLEIVGNDVPISLPAAKQRQLLAALLVRAGEARSTDVLIDALWGAAPPASAAKLLQVYVSQLRKVLPAPARIRTRGGGYLLQLEGGSLDAARFEHLLAEGRAASQEGNVSLAASLLRRALALWRGPAYGEFAYEEFARPEAERLEELRLVALEERLEAELLLGHHAELLPELSGLAGAEPLRERLQAQAMLALYRCGRQSEALDVYTAARARLHDELGLEPGSELRGLQRRILEHDPELTAVPAAEAGARSLPSPANRLVGRERELEHLGGLLLRGDVRLVVLTGAGGSGKTRLALEAARNNAAAFANGAAFVELAPLRDPSLVVPTIARALGVEESLGEPVETLAAALHPRELLLVLDNFEHLRAAAPLFVELFTRAPRLTLLVTSRVVLHLSGEHVYPVEPLAGEAAPALFHERALEVDARFRPDAADERAIHRICERLDGLPLAIELAAGHVRTLTPGELLTRLEPRLPLLTGGPHDLPARQQTLRATLDWSYDLLDADEQRDLRRLSVFAGGCTLEAAERVCGTGVERLAALIDHNLLLRTAGPGGSRYSMLETIREHAAERLEAAGESDSRRRHSEYFAAIAERVADDFFTAPVIDWFALERDHDNFRAALAWAVVSEERELAVRITWGLTPFWIHRGFMAEGARRSAEAVKLAEGLSLSLQAHAWSGAANVAMRMGQLDAARRLLERAIDAERQLGDRRSEGWSLRLLGAVAQQQGDSFDEAATRFDQARAIFLELGDEKALAMITHHKGLLAIATRDFGRARELLTESLARNRALGSDRELGGNFGGLGIVALYERRYDDAVPLFASALESALRTGWRAEVAEALQGLAGVLAVRGQLETAARVLGAAEALDEEVAQEMLHYLRQAFAETSDAVVAQRDEPAIAAAWAEGRTMSEADAAAYAMAAVSEQKAREREFPSRSRPRAIRGA